MKNAFTMIELVFVIVIVGILASIAIFKMTANRNNAQATKIIDNLAQVIAVLKFCPMIHKAN